jgi:oligopeptide transport system ATP-binding protein
VTAESIEPILRVEGLVKHYPVTSGAVRRKQVATLRAVDGVSFELRAGECLGIVGESGCGKSTLAQTLLRLVEPTAGHAWFHGRDIFAMDRRELRELRRKIQIVFQDPFESLNPRMTVGQILSEPWEIHPGIVPRAARRDRAGQLLEMVGLRPEHIDRYPAQFSGGQRQRIGVARALALEPEIIVCDEPVSALDVSVQAQVINLLQDVQQEFGLAYLFIAHDLGVVRHVADDVAVMYLGKVVEHGSEPAVFDTARHPYTHALLSAAPVARFAEAERTERILLTGEIPSPIDPPSGCTFHTRCWQAHDVCSRDAPLLAEQGADGHVAACHFPVQRDAAAVPLGLPRLPARSIAPS